MTGRRQRASPAERRAERGAIDDPGQVLDAAARLLESRPRSVAEVRRRLVSAGYRPDLVDAAVQRLVALGYLDDDAFARSWVESRDRARPRGERALRQELRLKGVDAEVVDAVLEQRDDAELAAAGRLLERQLHALARVADPRARRQRAYAVLARNGFDPDVASSAVRAWLATQVADPVDDGAPLDDV